MQGKLRARSLGKDGHAVLLIWRLQQHMVLSLHKQTHQLWSQQGDEGMPAAETDISTGLQLILWLFFLSPVG